MGFTLHRFRIENLLASSAWRYVSLAKVS